ncbi:hypothetical protein AVEN_259033-1 [Araneus ventricosus]|uniref:Uncharacterized protein n=1 Tax=Araneus ventricosus TaxID=182803 RepID=A0A4Y2UAF6_ARAVE|nr:hypothetical protein AVEN_259033-1 [Araneus ventricosus]
MVITFTSFLPRLSTKHFKAAIKQSEEKSPNISRCTALTVKHTNMQAYVFMGLIPRTFRGFTWKGSLKSTPTLENDLLKFIYIRRQKISHQLLRESSEDGHTAHTSSLIAIRAHRNQ